MKTFNLNNITTSISQMNYRYAEVFDDSRYSNMDIKVSRFISDQFTDKFEIIRSQSIRRVRFNLCKLIAYDSNYLSQLNQKQ